MARMVTLVLLLKKCTVRQLYPCPFTISVTLWTSSQGILDWNLIVMMAWDAHCLPHQLFSSSVIFSGYATMSETIQVFGSGRRSPRRNIPKGVPPDVLHAIVLHQGGVEGGPIDCDDVAPHQPQAAVLRPPAGTRAQVHYRIS